MSNIIERTAQIVLCPQCKGQGFTIEEKRINVYETKDIQSTCSLCKGKRVLKRVVTIKYEEV